MGRRNIPQSNLKDRFYRVKFTIVFEIEPSTPFGLSMTNWPVLRAREGETLGDTNKLSDLSRIDYGSRSEDRLDEEALHLIFQIKGIEFLFKDNFVHIATEAPDMYKAHEIAIREFDIFLGNLSSIYQRFFSFRPVSIESEDGEYFELPTPINTKATIYDLEHLSNSIQEAIKYQNISDEKLLRSLQYFRLAMFELEERKRVIPIITTFERKGVRDWFISSIFLNLWKALSTIVGDPSQDKDHQRRYESLGFDYDFYLRKIKKAHGLRNNYDVAHYSLDEEKITQIDANISEVLETVISVISRYRDYLLKSRLT